LNSDQAIEVVNISGCGGEGGVAGLGLVLVGWLAWERGGYVGRNGGDDETTRKKEEEEEEEEEWKRMREAERKEPRRE